MFIKTRKLPPTLTKPARMQATMIGGTATLIIPFPHEAEDPHRSVALMFARAYGYTRVVNPLSHDTFQAQGMREDA